MKDMKHIKLITKKKSGEALPKKETHPPGVGCIPIK